MSICTRTGDLGTTALMFNRRVSKTHPRIEACGAIDELNAAIGLARAASPAAPVTSKLLHIQQELVNVMGEIATAKEDLQRYTTAGFQVLGANSVLQLETWIHELEALDLSFKGWATPGENPAAAALDLARTVARRAERRVQELLELNELENRQLQIYLNRASDLLWLLARHAESRM